MHSSRTTSIWACSAETSPSQSSRTSADSPRPIQSARRPLLDRDDPLLAPAIAEDEEGPAAAFGLDLRLQLRRAGLPLRHPRTTCEPPTIASVPSSPKTIQALLPPS